MLIQLSYNLLLSTKSEDHSGITEGKKILAEQSGESILTELDSDVKKMVFWINIYNAFFQLLAVQYRTEYADSFKGIFGRKEIQVGHEVVSLDEIEHEILRRSKSKWSLGFLSKWGRKTIRRWRVKKMDYRIHFMLNCGAVSCPVIRPIHAENIADELAAATTDYLHQEVVMDHKNKTIRMNQLFLFYWADFGGKKGVFHLLEKEKVMNVSHRNYRIKFTPFDREKRLSAYKK